MLEVSNIFSFFVSSNKLLLRGTCSHAVFNDKDRPFRYDLLHGVQYHDLDALEFSITGSNGCGSLLTSSIFRCRSFSIILLGSKQLVSIPNCILTQIAASNVPGLPTKSLISIWRLPSALECGSGLIGASSGRDLDGAVVGRRARSVEVGEQLAFRACSEIITFRGYLVSCGVPCGMIWGWSIGRDFGHPLLA